MRFELIHFDHHERYTGDVASINISAMSLPSKLRFLILKMIPSKHEALPNLSR